MRALSASELLAVWERGQSEPPYRRALLLLAAACPEEPRDDLARIDIGTRDARLLTLREWTFGPNLTGDMHCTACGERMEISTHLDELRTTAPPAIRDELNLKFDEYRVDFRLPNALDLEEAHGRGNTEEMRAALIRRCILKARRHHEELHPEQLPATVMEAVVGRMAEVDPRADTHLAVACPGCGHRCHALFDVVSFFWSEIQAWAVRILREVHILASAYGWREIDILAMSALRRQSYLNMVGV